MTRPSRFSGGAVAGSVRCLAVLAVMACATGCTTPTRTFEPARDPSTLSDTVYLHYLASVPVATVDEGTRAVLMLLGPTAAYPDYERRFAELRSLGAVKDRWQLQPNQILTFGTLGYMLAATCDLPRGVNDVLSAMTGLAERRYALRTCIDAGLLKYARAHDPVSGGELLSAITEADAYRSRRAADEP